MSSFGSRPLSSDSVDSEDFLHVPANSNDPGWKYIRLTKKGDTQSVKCMLCFKKCKAGISRMKKHLAGIPGDIQPCPKATHEIKKDIQEHLEITMKKKEDKSRQAEEIRAGVDIFGETEGDDDVVVVAKKPRLKGPIDTHVVAGLPAVGNEKGKMEQTSIKDSISKEHRNKVSDNLAFWAYKCSISFNALTDSAFLAFCEALGNYGPRYKPPTMYEYRVPLLKRQVEKTNETLMEHRDWWQKWGCTIMTDSWTDRRGRSLMNLCVNSEKGTCFLRVVNGSADTHSAEYILEFVESGIKEVGVENVIHVVTDNASANLAAGRMLMKKYSRIYWTSCAAHCIDLMLERICKDPRIHGVLEKAKKVTSFIYNHHKTLALMRVYTENKEIVRPGVTRFATAFLTLNCFYQLKSKLKRMFVGNRYNSLSISKSHEGKRVASIVISDERFWTDLELSIGIFLPLVKLLRLVDGDKRPASGFIFGGLMDAKREVIELLGRANELELCIPVVNAIDHYIDGKLDSELHLVAYYLNPYYFYRDRANIVGSEQIFGSVLKFLERFYQNEEIQDKITKEEMLAYSNALGTFGSSGAKRQRDKLDETFNPAHWWTVWGSTAPYLQGIATKILNLTCTSSGCERNWSAFEWTQSKRRSKLDVQRLNDIVYVQFNSRMKNSGNKRKKEDPIMATCEEDEIPNAKEWLEGESLETEEGNMGGNRNVEAWGCTSATLTRCNSVPTRGEKNLLIATNKSARGKKPGKKSGKSSSSQGTSSPLVTIDENSKSVGSDPDTEVSDVDIDLGSDSE